MTAMRLLGVAAAVAFLLWVFVRDPGDDRGWSLRADRAIDQFALGDRALQRDLLSARAGILRDYDPMNRDADLALQAAEDIVALGRDDPALSRSARILAADLEVREGMVERFKTDNALLQNSLARFASLSPTLAGSPGAARMALAVLGLTLNTGPDAVHAANESLGAFGRSRSASPWLHVHGALLVRLLPEVDAILAACRASPVGRDAMDVRRLILAHEAANAAARTWRRVLTTAGVTLTVGMLAVLAFGLYARDRDLIRRAEAERLSATVSGLLIGAQPHDLAEHIERVLQQLALHLGADSAYLALGAQTFCWTGTGRPSPAEWRCLAALAAQRGSWRGHLLKARIVDVISDDLRAAMAEVGKTGLLLIRGRPVNQGEAEAMLGMTCTGSPPVVRSEIAAGLVAALAAIRATVQRDRLESDRIRLERRLALARRMETVGALASGVAHNFNNIMGAISGFSEMAELHVARDSKALDDLAEIRQAVARARDLVEQILSFGRRSQGGEQAVDLPDLMAETARMLRASLPRTVDFQARLEPVGGVTQGDPAQIQQAVMNICHNAAHAQAGAGRVVLGLSRCVLGHALALSHGALERGVYGVIVIEDEGPGVPAAITGRIFEPFFSTRRGGTGLGLSTAWEIVQAHGGTIDLHSEPGRGAAFSIWLPLSPPAAAFQALPMGEGEAVLLVALEPDRAGDDAEQVAVLGYDVSVAADAAQALALCAQGTFDLVLVAGARREAVERAAEALAGAAGAARLVAAFAGGGDETAADALAYPLQQDALARALAGRFRPGRFPEGQAEVRPAPPGRRISPEISG